MSVNVESIQFESGEFARVLRWSEDVDAVESMTAEGKIVPFKGTGSLWHLHDEIELTLVTSGHGTRLVGDQVAQFVAPCLMLLGSNLPHYLKFAGKSSGLCIQLSLSRLEALVPPSAIGELSRLARRSAKGLVYRRQAVEKYTNVLQDLCAASGLSRMGALLQLFSDLARTRSSSADELSSKRFDVNRLAPGYEGIQKAIVLIMSQFSDQIAIEDVLTASLMSKANFSRRFCAYTGKTFTEFLNEVRIDYACQQLMGTCESIGEIAYSSGYENLSHFNRMFRRHRDCSPSVYRRSTG